MQKIQVSNSPKPVGHYSQAIVSNGLLFTSGILPIKIKTSEKLSPESTINKQLEVVFQNLEIILKEASLTPNEVVKTTVYITNGEDWGIINQTFAELGISLALPSDHFNNSGLLRSGNIEWPLLAHVVVRQAFLEPRFSLSAARTHAPSLLWRSL